MKTLRTWSLAFKQQVVEQWISGQKKALRRSHQELARKGNSS
jgi:transposase-like protein